MSDTRPKPAPGMIAARWGDLVRGMGVPRLIIVAFLLVLFSVAAGTGMNLASLISQSVDRIARNGILVLALLPAIQGGLGLNFGLPLGILCGLVGCVITINFGVAGWTGFAMATFLGSLLAVPIGWVYGWLLNRTRGQEMMVGTYIGFAMVSLMSIFWLLAPFRNPRLVWAIGGKGLRTTLTLNENFEKILDKFLQIRIGDLVLPTGALLYFGLICFLVWIFFRTRAGLSISAAGDNPRFARASGIQDSRTRIQAAMLTTVLGAAGIVAFSQSYGFVQLYQAPLMMAFPAVACILIGGASVVRASIRNVIIGTFLFQTILTIALPVTSQVIQGDVSETARLVIQNGMILYALTRRGDRT
ncbi:MAG: ABC transporter permease [Candidatus Eisenbacteria bacterium]|nr:ABC transporter permease [Candidatus Eisenbacteria bacterium]